MADEETRDSDERGSNPVASSPASVKSSPEPNVENEMERMLSPSARDASPLLSSPSSGAGSSKDGSRNLQQGSRPASQLSDISKSRETMPSPAIKAERFFQGSVGSSQPGSAAASDKSRPDSGVRYNQLQSEFGKSDTKGPSGDGAGSQAGSQRSPASDSGLRPSSSGKIPPSSSTNNLAAAESRLGNSGPPPSDPGDGGDDSDDNDDDEDEGGDDIIDTEDSDQETDLVVLDPDHPLMVRFQNALHAHLSKQDEKATLDLRELDNILKKRRKEREDLGAELYGQQQELARYQMMLEKTHDEYFNLHQERQKEEQELSDVRHLYTETQTTVNKDKKKASELQAEVENIALRIFYMENAKEDVRSDIAIMRRAAEKAENEVTKTEVEKQKQDLFVDRLVEQVDKLKEEIALYEAQIAAQSDETKAARDALMEANMEIEAISLEKKQLYQQWSSSLIGMRRRDEAHSAMQDALHQQEQKILSMDTEIEGYKKSINKEQEQNEKLTLILSKTEHDIETVKKQFTQCTSKHEALKAEYTTYTRMLHETEQALNRAMTDKSLRQNELVVLRKQIEREYLEKVKLEDELMEHIRTQLTMDKAVQYTKKLTNKLREKTKHLETQMAEVENTIAAEALEMANTKARAERLKKIMQQLGDDIKNKNDIITKSENEILKRSGIIERKQTVIDQYNKKLEQLIIAAGGVELGPLEITINSLIKSIDMKQVEIDELQQQWLKQQNELVKLTKERDEQTRDVERLRKQLTILSQKKIKTECEIDQQNREIYDVERTVRNMRNDIIKLNTLICKKGGTQEFLEHSNVLAEGDFIGALKDAELESIELQARLDAVKEDKEKLLNSLVEAERQIMLWEKKAQLAREMRAAVDSEVGQGEIKAMKAEIHRMQVRYAQLMKTQERMIQDMEKSVSRRDSIVTQGQAQQSLTGSNKNAKTKVWTKGTFERQMMDLRKKIKTTVQEANKCDDEIKSLREQQIQLSQQLEERQINCQQLQSNSDTLDGDIEHILELKQKNMTDLLTKQQRVKYYQQMKDGKYTKLCKTESALLVEGKKQTERLLTLSTIVDSLNQEFPSVQPSLRNVTLILSARTADLEESQ